MEGGGVRGIGLVGALTILAERGYSIHRVAGTSAGAIVGSLVAAGMPLTDLRQCMETLDYHKFQDPGLIDQLGLPGKALSLLFEQGIYEGDYLREWVDDCLDNLGVHTFGDLRLAKPWAQDLPPERRYKLVVVAADITRGRLVHLPWDYHLYGLNPDTQRVSDAIRSSMSFPFFYEPARLGASRLVDGGVLSNFPIDLFDNTFDWPTFGVKLSAKSEAVNQINPTHNTLEFTLAILSTMLNARDAVHLDDPSVTSRTMFVDTTGVKTLDFDITAQQQATLYASGRHGAEKFLDTWNFSRWKTTYSKTVLERAKASLDQ